VIVRANLVLRVDATKIALLLCTVPSIFDLGLLEWLGTIMGSAVILFVGTVTLACTLSLVLSIFVTAKKALLLVLFTCLNPLDIFTLTINNILST